MNPASENTTPVDTPSSSMPSPELDEVQQLLEEQLDRSHQVWNTEVTRDAIWHFCLGVGDDNPLYTDVAYATNSALRALTAPPTFLSTIDTALVFVGLAGRPTLHIGTEWRWDQRLHVGMKVTADARYVGARETTGRTAGKLILQTGEATYRDSDGRVIGSCRTTTARAPANEKRGVGYEPRSHVYASEEIDAIGRACVAERPRGAEARYWDDVVVNDSVGPIVKGPLSLLDMMCWYAGNGLHGRRAHRIGWKEVERNRDHWRRAKSGAFEHVGQGHVDSQGAKDWGMPGAYDNGIQRAAWLGHLVTDWMGDEGFLKALTCRIVRPNVFGDTTWLSGRVAEIVIDDAGDPVALLELEGRNQLGELSTTGTATVRLPRAA